MTVSVSVCVCCHMHTCLEGRGRLSFLKSQSVFKEKAEHLRICSWESALSRQGARQTSQLWSPALLSSSHVLREPLSPGFYLSPQATQTLPLLLWVAVMFIRLMSSVLGSALKWRVQLPSAPGVPFTYGLSAFHLPSLLIPRFFDPQILRKLRVELNHFE